MVPLALCMELVRHGMAGSGLNDGCNAAMRSHTRVSKSKRLE